MKEIVIWGVFGYGDAFICFKIQEKRLNLELDEKLRLLLDSNYGVRKFKSDT